MVGQSNQFEKGYYDGYCQAHKNSDDINQNGPCPVLGTYPLPEPMKESYQDGFAKGMQDYAGKGSSRGKADAALLESHKKLSETNGFVDYSKTISQSTATTYVPPSNTQEQSDELLVNKLPQYKNLIQYLEFTDLYGFGSGTAGRLRQGCRRNGFKAVRTSTPYRITMKRSVNINPENTLRVEMEKECVYSRIEGIRYMDCYYTTKVYDTNNEFIYHNKSVNGGTKRQIDLIRKAMRL